MDNKSPERFPPRIHILLAKDEPLGLVIRRGPSKLVGIFRWNRQTDDFELGQWFKGRIYERRSDLSFNGRHFIYFAMNGKWDSETEGAWTAISRAPYLKALALFPKGDCWNGGGLWLDRRRYWLNDGGGHSVLRDTDEVVRESAFEPSEQYGGECCGVYYHRLLRDGWRLISREGDDDVFEKPIDAAWVLRKIAHATTNAPEGKGCYWDEHQLVNNGRDRVIECPSWEWADLDQDRLVWASKGKMFTGSLVEEGLQRERMLYDFNQSKFEAVEAPY